MTNAEVYSYAHQLLSMPYEQRKSELIRLKLKPDVHKAVTEKMGQIRSVTCIEEAPDARGNPISAGDLVYKLVGVEGFIDDSRVYRVAELWSPGIGRCSTIYAKLSDGHSTYAILLIRADTWEKI